VALIAQRTRIRARRRAGSPTLPLFRSFAYAGNSLLSAMPNRAARRRLTGQHRLVLATASSALLVAAAFTSAGLAQHTRRAPAAAPDNSAPIAAAPAPALPESGGAAVPADTPLPRLTAVLAADLWQLSSAVYQASVSAKIDPPAPVAAAVQPSGPSVEELLRAQARFAAAQLTLQAVQQRAADDQIAAARASVAQAAALVEAAQQAAITNAALARQVTPVLAITAVAAAPAAPAFVATPTPAPAPAATIAPTAPALAPVPAAVAPVVAPTVDAARLRAAQQDVDLAQIALDNLQHPYSADTIAGARGELQSAQQALATAQARLQAQAAAISQPVAAAQGVPAVVAQPVAPIEAPIRQATAPPAAAQPAVVTQLAVVVPDARKPLAAGPAAGRLAPGAPAAATVDANGETCSAPVRLAGGGEVTACTPVESTSVPAGRAAVQVAPAAAAPIATQVPALPAPAIDPPASAIVRPVTAGTPPQPVISSAEIDALQHRVRAAEQNVALYSAAPDAAQVRSATNALAASQARLTTLQRRSESVSTIIPTAIPTAEPQIVLPPTPAPTAEPQPSPTRSPQSAPTISPQPAPILPVAPVESAVPLDAAEMQYSQAVAQLQAVSAEPDPATVKAAQDEYYAARQSLLELVAHSDKAIVAQMEADPQQALAKDASNVDAIGHTDLLPFVWPAHGPITSFFGPGHPLGIDIAQGLGLPVTAAASGTVSFTGGNACCSYGYYVDITHPGGYVTRYGHLLTPSFLKSGDHVVQGQLIGVSGSTGFSTGPHLHFEIRQGNVPLDPLRLLSGVLPTPLIH